MTEPNPAPKRDRRQYNREWLAANRERARAQARKRYAADGQRQREYQRKYYAENREKISTRRKLWRKPDDPRAARRQHLKSTHGLDEVTWQAIWDAQNGCCYLCRDALDMATVHVEHYHGCLAHPPKKSCSLCRRGLACQSCNLIIGRTGDDPVLLRAIADNLEAANADVMERQRGAPQSITLF
jgi:hypothetical protein